MSFSTGRPAPIRERELALLADDGRLVLLASHLGATAEVNVRDIVRRRLTLTGATLRPRPPAYKGRIAAELVAQVWPLLEDGRIRVHVCATFPLAAVAQAHALMDANEQIGKVLVSSQSRDQKWVPVLRDRALTSRVRDRSDWIFFRKPGSTFRDHALTAVSCRPSRRSSPCSARSLS